MQGRCWNETDNRRIWCVHDFNSYRNWGTFYDESFTANPIPIKEQGMDKEQGMYKVQCIDKEQGIDRE